MNVHRRRQISKTLVTFVAALLVAGGLVAFVLIPGSIRRVVYFGDCSPPPGGTSCTPPHETVFQTGSVGGVWARALIALGVLVAALLGYYLKRRRFYGGPPLC
jgi:putative copper export protein